MLNATYDYNIIGAGDTGNSKFKGYFTFGDGVEHYVEEKSLTSKLLTKPVFTDQTLERAIENLMDNMIVDINSKSIRYGGLYAIGEKAAVSSGRVRNMNINTGSKHTDELPILTTLAIIATKAVQQDFRKNEQLARELTLNVDYSTAIPAREYTKKTAQSLENRYIDGEHNVVVYVSEDEYVSVKINFNRVKVTQEGNPASYAIFYGDQELLVDYQNDYNNAVTNEYFGNKKILHVDIGDGTTEFVYTDAGTPKADLSSGERYGVGHAAAQALRAYSEDIKVQINMNRQDFMDAVINVNHIQHDEAKNAMLMASIDQAQAITEKIEEMYIDILKGDVEVVCVFGGGSAQFKHVLKEMLLDLSQQLNFEVLWIPDLYSAKINAVGLKELNDRVFFKV